MNTNLFKAILAMDSYNRGYGEGIILPVILNTTKIGNATIVSQSDTTATSQPVLAGFYGISYQLAGGEKVVSYRGTDTAPQLWAAIQSGDLSKLLTPDVLNGYGVGAGSPVVKQAELAIKFYQSVAGAESDWRSANISVTGHSLGGGLAGLVGSLYNRTGLLFNNMAYQGAADNAYKYSTGYYKYVPIPNSNEFEEIFVPANTELKKLIYGTGSTIAANYVNLNTIYMQDEFLTTNRLLQTGGKIPLNLGYDASSNLSGTQLHSMATMVMQMYANTEVVDRSWEKAAKYFWPVAYDNGFADAIGMNTTLLSGRDRTDGEYAAILRQIITYSAIDEGDNDTNARPFGDTAIRAFYNDANDLGKVLNLANGSSYLLSKAGLISQSFIQYAGQLALSKILSSGNQDALNGILRYSPVPDLSNSNTLNYNVLEIDFSDTTWKAINFGEVPPMIARADLIESILKDIGGGDSSFVRSKMQELWGDNTTNIFEKVVFVASDSFAWNGSKSSPSPLKSTLFITSDELSGFSNLIGTNGSDLFYGSGRDNSFIGSKGKDIYFGGAGIDFISYHALAQGIIVDSENLIIKYLETNPDKNDYLSSIERIAGTLFNDYFFVSETNRIIFYGNGGNDTYDLSWLLGPVSLNVFPESASWKSLSGSNLDTLSYSTDNFILTTQNDIISAETYSRSSYFPGGQRGLTDIFINAGSGVDTFKTSYFNPFVDSSGTLNLGLTRIQNAEIYELYSVTIQSLGRKYISNYGGFGSRTELDYSLYDKKLTFNITSGMIEGSVTDGIKTDIIGSNNQYGFSHILGTNFGDDYVVDASYQYTNYTENWFTKYILTGLGNDTFKVNKDYASVLFIYSGGHDVSYGAQIVLSPDIRVSDLSYSGNVLYINGKGSITLAEYNTSPSVYLPNGEIYYAGQIYRGNPNAASLGMNTQFADVVYEQALLNSYQGRMISTGSGNDIIYLDRSVGTQVFSGIGDDIIYGNATGDVVFSGYVDQIFAGFGNDRIYGSDNIDYIYGELGNDDISGALGNDVISGDGGDDNLNGEGGNDEVLGGSGNDTILGGDGNDILSGDDGNDLLRGGKGNDGTFGRDGNDTYLFSLGDGQDIVTDEGSGDIDTIKFDSGIISSMIRFWNNGFYDSLDIFYGATDKITVSNQFTLPSELTGKASQNGIDQVVLSDGTVFDLRGVITFTGTNSNDVVKGTTKQDTLIGLFGNDTLIGFSGDDSLEGGSGNDIYIYNSGDGFDTILDISGSDQINIGAGFLSTDMTTRVSGNNLMISLKGIDSILIQSQMTGSVVEKIRFSDGTTLDLPVAIPSINGVSGNDNLLGTAANETLNGFAGDDVLNGGAGIDTMIGGLGNDTYVLENIGDIVTELSNEGTDIIESSVTYTLSLNVENLTLTGVLIINGTGNDLNNVLTGNSAANILNAGIGRDFIEGGAGADIIDGGIGWDSARYTSSESAVSINLETNVNTGGDAEGDILLNIEAVIGSNFNDILIGGNGNDYLVGGRGNDILIGGKGVDALNGGNGADIFRFLAKDLDATSDGVTDFRTNQGDKIDIKDLLFGYDPVTSAITDFVEFTTSGANTVVKIDRDGTDTNYNWQQIVKLDNVTGLTDEAALRTNGNLIIA